MKGMSNVARGDLQQNSLSALNTDRSARKPIAEKKLIKPVVTPTPKPQPKQSKAAIETKAKLDEFHEKKRQAEEMLLVGNTSPKAPGITKPQPAP